MKPRILSAKPSSLGSCGAATEEGRVGAAPDSHPPPVPADKYAASAALFYFVLVEAPALPVTPPLVLQPADRHRLRRYAAGVGARHAACLAQVHALPQGARA